MYYLDEKEVQAVQKVLLTQKLFRYRGKSDGECDRFEKALGKKMGSPFALLVSSGTNALIAALAACQVGPGDEVIIPSYTFIASAVAVKAMGAVPIIVNIDESLTINPREVAARLSGKTKAIMAVHMDGLACDMDSLRKLCPPGGPFLIEDAAQAMGGRYRTQRLGTLGDIGCYSFNYYKIISCGEGGALVTGNREFYERALCFHDSACPFGDTKKKEFQIPPFLGLSMRVSEISGAIMRVQLGRLDGILRELRKRKKIFQHILGENFVLGGGHDRAGDCATSLHLSFAGIPQLKRAYPKLEAIHKNIIPLLELPAHRASQWAPLLGPKIERDFRSDRDILSKILKVSLDPRQDLKTVEKLAKKTLNILQGVS